MKLLPLLLILSSSALGQTRDTIPVKYCDCLDLSNRKMYIVWDGDTLKPVRKYDYDRVYEMIIKEDKQWIRIHKGDTLILIKHGTRIREVDNMKIGD